MRKKLPILLMILFLIVVFFRIFIIYSNFDQNVLNEKKYEILVGELEYYLKPYEKNSVKFNFAKVLNLYESTLKKIESENLSNNSETDKTEISTETDVFKVSDQFREKMVKLNQKLNNYTEKYILPDYNAEIEKKKKEDDKKDDEVFFESPEKIKIDFDEGKREIQKKTLEKLKQIMSDKDYKNLEQLVNEMNETSSYTDMSKINSMYQILSKYKEIPAQITCNQLRGLYKVIAYYEMENNEPVKKDFPVIVEEKEDYEEYKEIINLEKEALAGIYDNYFKGFFIFTDGEGNMLSDSCDYQKETRGYLGIDIEDFKNGIENDFDRSRFFYSMTREVANVLVTEKNQIDYFKIATLCLTDFKIIKSAARKDAYIYQFYNRFWDDTMYLDSIATSYNIKPNARKYFYLRHRDEFLNEYASENPFKDLIESMTRFILLDKYADNSVTDDKIRYFYEFPEIMELKEIINQNINKLS